jgi:signal transduction histidine kinase
MQLENAVRHTPSGGQILLGYREISAEELAERVMVLWDFYPDIDQRLLRQRNYVLISVSDTGEGIAADEKLKIFKPFYTTGVNHHHSERRGDGGKGFGLGLSLAKKIVEAHDGLMWVEDRPDGGSCFLQLLPLPD